MSPGPFEPTGKGAAERDPNDEAETLRVFRACFDKGKMVDVGKKLTYFLATGNLVSETGLDLQRSRLKTAPALFEHSAPLAPMASLEARSGPQQPQAAAQRLGRRRGLPGSREGAQNEASPLLEPTGRRQADAQCQTAGLLFAGLAAGRTWRRVLSHGSAPSAP